MTQNDSKSKNVAEPEKKSNDSSDSEDDIETFTFRRPKVMPSKRRSSNLSQRKGKGKAKSKAEYMKAKR